MTTNPTTTRVPTRLPANQAGGDLAVRAEEGALLSAADIKARVKLVHEVMSSVMVKDVHYGKIPGTPKPSLWQPGAEKLAMTFGLAVRCEVVESLITDEEAEFRVRATAYARDGSVLGSEEAACSTREKKYRWRSVVVEEEWNETPDHLRRVVWKKGYDRNPPFQEHQVRTDVGDLINTMLRMASKRAKVAVVRSVTACSDIFEVGGDEGDDGPGGAAQRPGTPDALVSVSAVKELKSGQNAEGAWTLYGVTLSDGRKATTFSASIAARAREAMEAGYPVDVKTSKGRKPDELNLEALAPA